MKNARFFHRLGFALSGIRSAFKSESSFRFQTAATLGAFTFLGVLKAAPTWWALFTLSIAGVLGAELFNTALENLTDRLHPEIHPTIKIVKDCASGAVLIFSIASILVLASFTFETYFSLK